MSDTSNSDFLLSNKKSTLDFRKILANAVVTTGTIPTIKKMAFGDQGETDQQGNPAVPTDNGALNHVVLTKDIETATVTDATACFTCTITAGEITATINEVALIDSNGNTAAKMRLLTGKGVDGESGLEFKWYEEF